MRCWEVGNYVIIGVGVCLRSALPVVIGAEKERGHLIWTRGNKHLGLVIKTDWTQAPLLREQENKIRWVRYSPTMIESYWKRAIQIPMLFHSKISVGNCLIPAWDDATQESASAFMLVQHLCHHWHQRADSSFPCQRENNWRSLWFTKLNTLKSCIKKKTLPKYLPLEVISAFLYNILP